MGKLKCVFAGIIILSCFVYVSTLSAETNNSTSTIQTLQEQINSLLKQITEMQTKMQELKSQIKDTKEEIKEVIGLYRNLSRGMSGEDVKHLQEIMATDPEIYPEGLVTGYYGPLTEKAVKNFQKKMGVEQAGAVGPKTMSKVNELLKEGNVSGKVPPGLLIAPGIRGKITFTPQPLFGQILPYGIAKKLGITTSTPGENQDTVAPVISNVTATSTAATTTMITWVTNENADSKVWYDIATPLSISSTTPMVNNSNLVVSHNLGLSSITASTTYYYKVSSSDASGNTATSSEYSFTTLP